MRKITLYTLGVVILSFLFAAYISPLMPERMASHWNTSGQVDGYISKFWGLYLLPIVSAVMFLLLFFIPKLDPLKENIEKFRKYFDAFILLLVLFMVYIYGLTLAWNFGYQFSMVRFLAPAFAVLMYSAGILISKTEPNWTIGIRTPWTLSSPVVWKKTHQLGGKLFRYAALLSLLAVLFPDYGIVFILVPILGAALTALVYSYVVFRREKH